MTRSACLSCGLVHEDVDQPCEEVPEYNHEHERHRARHQKQDRDWANARNKKVRRKFREQQERENS